MSPEGLHAFWRRTTESLRRTPLRATRTDAPAQSGREYVISLMQMDSFEGKRLRAWYTVPKDPVPGGRAPAVLAVPGYGGDKPIPTHLAVSGFAVLTLYPRGQGESSQEWTLEHSTKLTYHMTDKERFYYRSAYIDCVRGLDFLASHPEVDAARLGMWSRSQGGGLTLAPSIQYPTLVNVGMRDEVCPAATILPVCERITAPKALPVYPDLTHSPCTDLNAHATHWLRRSLGA